MIGIVVLLAGVAIVFSQRERKPRWYWNHWDRDDSIRYD